MSWKENKDWRRLSPLANTSGWPWRWTKKEEQDWKMMPYMYINIVLIFEVRVRCVLVVCKECYNWKIDRSYVVVPCPPPPFYFDFEYSNLCYLQFFSSRNELAHPVMGTIFLLCNCVGVRIYTYICVCTKKNCD